MVVGLLVGVAGTGVCVDVGRVVAVEEAVCVIVGLTGNGLGVEVSGVFVFVAGGKVSGMSAWQAASVNNRMIAPIKTRRMA